MADLYKILGVNKNASSSELKKAYHKLARQYHPDTNKGNKTAEAKFKEVSGAYEILSDKTKRSQYDQGLIDDQGKPTSPFSSGGFGQGYSGGNNQYYSSSGGGFSGFNFEDIFSGFSSSGGFEDLFRSRSTKSSYNPKGADVKYTLSVDFILSAIGGETSIRLSSGKQIKIKIPAGIESGQTLRLKGQGEGTSNPGDALIEIHVLSHPIFTRDNLDVRLNIPITLKEAVLGAKITIPTLTGRVSLTIPPNTSSGKVLRLKGKGIASKGDLLGTIQIILPTAANKELENFVRHWNMPSQDPRPLF